MKKRFSDEQIISIFREGEAGMPAHELCRKHAISNATFYPWHKKYGGMEVPEVKRLKSLEEENARCWPKPCWIRKRFRWPLGESTDGKPETRSSGVDV